MTNCRSMQLVYSSIGISKFIQSNKTWLLLCAIFHTMDNLGSNGMELVASRLFDQFVGLFKD